MKFTETAIEGVYVIALAPFVDDRGTYSRIFCEDTFKERGLRGPRQINYVNTKRAGTIRGLHWQAAPCEEAKLVRCVRGKVLDICVDMRPGSSTFGEYVTTELNDENRLAVYVPPLFAHAFQTLVDDVDVIYGASHGYTPGHERGLRFDDPHLNIDWPVPVVDVTDKDKNWPDLAEQRKEIEA